MAKQQKNQGRSNVVQMRPVKVKRAPAVKQSSTEKLQERLNREKMLYTAKANRNTSIIDSKVERLKKIADEKLRIKTAKADAIIANRAATAQQKQDARDAKVHAKEAHLREKDQIKLDRDTAIARMRIDLQDELQAKQGAMIAQDQVAAPAASSLPFENATSNAPVETIPASGNSPVTDESAVEPQRASDFEDGYQDSEVTDVWGGIPEKDVGDEPANVEANNERFDITQTIHSGFDQPSFEGVKMNNRVNAYVSRVRAVNPVFAKFLSAELDKHDLSGYDGLSGDDGFLKSIGTAASKAVASYGDYVADRINRKNPDAAKREKEKAVEKEVVAAQTLAQRARDSASTSFMGDYYPFVIGAGVLIAGWFLLKAVNKKKRK